MPVNPDTSYTVHAATARRIVLWVLDQALMSTRLGDLNGVISGQAVDQALRDAADFVLKHATAAEMEDLVAVITSFCCRLYGLRRGINKVKALKEICSAP